MMVVWSSVVVAQVEMIRFLMGLKEEPIELFDSLVVEGDWKLVPKHLTWASGRVEFSLTEMEKDCGRNRFSEGQPERENQGQCF